MTPPLPGRYDSTSVALDRLSEGTKKTLPRYQEGASIPLGRLAVSKTFQRRHIVSLLVFDARSAMSLRGHSSLFRLKMSRCSIYTRCMFQSFMTRQCTCGCTEHRH